MVSEEWICSVEEKANLNVSKEEMGKTTNGFILSLLGQICSLFAPFISSHYVAIILLKSNTNESFASDELVKGHATRVFH